LDQSTPNAQNFQVGNDDGFEIEAGSFEIDTSKTSDLSAQIEDSAQDFGSTAGLHAQSFAGTAAPGFKQPNITLQLEHAQAAPGAGNIIGADDGQGGYKATIPVAAVGAAGSGNNSGNSTSAAAQAVEDPSFWQQLDDGAKDFSSDALGSGIIKPYLYVQDKLPQVNSVDAWYGYEVNNLDGAGKVMQDLWQGTKEGWQRLTGDPVQFVVDQWVPQDVQQALHEGNYGQALGYAGAGMAATALTAFTGPVAIHKLDTLTDSSPQAALRGINDIEVAPASGSRAFNGTMGLSNLDDVQWQLDSSPTLQEAISKSNQELFSQDPFFVEQRGQRTQQIQDEAIATGMMGEQGQDFKHSSQQQQPVLQQGKWKELNNDYYAQYAAYMPGSQAKPVKTIVLNDQNFNQRFGLDPDGNDTSGSFIDGMASGRTVYVRKTDSTYQDSAYFHELGHAHADRNFEKAFNFEYEDVDFNQLKEALNKPSHRAIAAA
jgi:hypothetical protein